MILEKKIKKLKIISFWLFLFPSLAIIGSLFIHNYLVAFKFTASDYSSYFSDKVGNSFEINCSKENNYCSGFDGFFDSKVVKKDNLKLDQCFVNFVDYEFFDSSGKKFLHTDLYELKNDIWVFKKEYIDSEIVYKGLVTNISEPSCIKNDKIQYFIYKYIPPLSYIIGKTAKLTRSGLVLGTSMEINPFLKGEVSISNLVKRYPINYFFKTFLYIGVILMLLYWHSFNQVFKKIIDKKNNVYYYFGTASAIFLLIHVFFLGTTSDNEIIKTIRRLVLVLFLLFELLAQIFLSIKIFKNKKILTLYAYSKIVWTKIVFVAFVIFFSVIIILSLIIFDLPKSVDNILEWNYFMILLVFYLLSSLMWKKNN